MSEIDWDGERMIEVSEMVDDPFDLRVRGDRATKFAKKSPVTLSDPRTGPWSGNNQLGIEQPYSPAENNRQTILKLDEWGHPRVHTVTLGISYSEEAWRDQNFRFMGIVAEINFGVGGSTQVVRMNWVQGSQITLAMNAVNVIAEYQIQGGIGVDKVPTDLRLSAQVARGSVVSSFGDPELSLLNFAVPNATTAIDPAAVFRIPNFASRCYLVPTNDAFNTLMAASASSFAIYFLGAPLDTPTSGALISSIRMDQYLSAGGLTTGIQIPGRARYVALKNLDSTAAGAGETCFFNFGLTL